MIRIFDGHNDCVQRLQEYRPEGIDFLAAPPVAIWTFREP